VSPRPRSSNGNRARGLLRCAFIYAVALMAAVLTVRAMPGSSLLVRAAAADLVATLVVFVFSRLLKNSSYYDPYWSVVPPVLALYWLVAAAGGTDLRAVLLDLSPGTVRALIMAALIWYWAVRLTANWVRRWRGVGDEDWRYVQLKERAGAAGWLIDLVGIQLYPSIQVFLGSLAIYVVMTNAGSAAHLIGLVDVVGILVMVGAILLETVADRQLIRFRRGDRAGGQILDTGLWGVVRHPNYLGEILFWWGLWILALAGSPIWWTLIGPVSMTALFALISIPMMDKHLEDRYPAYARHKEDTAALVPRVF